jgi:hypothetical protein
MAQSSKGKPGGAGCSLTPVIFYRALRRNNKWQILKSVNIEVFLIKGNNIMYPCIHCKAYYRSISVIHRQISEYFLMSFFDFCRLSTLEGIISTTDLRTKSIAAV